MNKSSKKLVLRWQYRYWHRKFRQGWTEPEPRTYVRLCAKKAAHGYVNLCNDMLRSRHVHTHFQLYRINRADWLRRMMATRPILKLDPRRLP